MCPEVIGLTGSIFVGLKKYMELQKDISLVGQIFDNILIISNDHIMWHLHFSEGNNTYKTKKKQGRSWLSHNHLFIKKWWSVQNLKSVFMSFEVLLLMKNEKEQRSILTPIKKLSQLKLTVTSRNSILKSNSQKYLLAKIYLAPITS